jgi:integrase
MENPRDEAPLAVLSSEQSTATALVAPIRSRRADLTLAELIDSYLGIYAGRDHSRRYHLAVWRALLGAYKIPDLDADLIHDAIEAFKAEPRRRYVGKDSRGRRQYKELGQRSNASVNRHKAAVSACLQWAKHQRLTPKAWANPAREIRALPEDNARTRFLARDELNRLLAASRISAYPRLYLLVLMAVTTGARRGELMNLTFRDIDLRQKVARLHTSKNKQPRTLVLTDDVCGELRRCGIGHPDEFVFSSRYRADRKADLSTAWKKAVSTAALHNFRFHDLRHTCASYLAQNGAGLLEIAAVLGHKTLAMSQRYSHLTVDSQRRTIERTLGDIR